MIHLVLALSALAPISQEIDLDRLLTGMSPEQLLARRVTPEHLVAQKAGPAVVFIQTDVEVQHRDFFGRVFRHSTTNTGSGAVIRAEGFIVTNYHVVAIAKKITVHFEKSIDPHPYEAELLSFVPDEDLALLKIQPREGRPFPTIQLGTSSDLMIGERVIAIGNPYGHTHTVSAGIISGLHRDVTVQSPGPHLPTLQFDDLIQTDASINRGNSGGPLLNINGELIGINNAVNPAADNIGFAIPVDRVRAVLEQQLISPDRYRAWLGYEIHEDDRLEVRSVVPGGPAAGAGLRPGDRILSFDGQELRDLGSYRLARVALGPDRTVVMRVSRDRAAEDLRMRPLEKSDGLIFERLGLHVDRSYQGGRSFVRVAEVLEGSSADQIGLSPGDILEMVRPKGEIDMRPRRLERRQDLAQILAALPSGTPVEAYVRRDGAGYFGVMVTR